ncbi:hypothetical protein [Aureimonas leprariae]|uniref:Uncharacterized protein n=1 Tax=Plantimonas leprariae TaxID=2615207 RepID=A0A7V7PQB9_9HYPH|nr:hypothetical protein [Aureimonas leprariae]KAB0680247.1 hypothetical protein F6X38_08685 [Aureimonas leprariae]
MADRLQNFRNKVDDGYDGWRANVGLPYIAAYAAAHDKFQQVKAQQEKVDLARAELFVTAASIVTGSVLMATVGQASLRALASRAALSMICRYNLNLAFTVLHAGATNPTVVFALGKVLDEVRTRLTKEAQDAVKNAVTSTASLATLSPTAQHAKMEQVLTNYKLCAHKVAESIENDASLSEQRKHSLFEMMLRAPIANPPSGTTRERPLSDKIELSFYMAALLESDSLEEVPAQYFGSGESGISGGRSSPIEISPNAKAYPKATGGQSRWWGTEAGTYVAYSDLGSAVDRRIEELHRAVYSSPFHVSGRAGGRAQQKAADLRKAEDTLKRLATETRPQNFLDVRV